MVYYTSVLQREAIDMSENTYSEDFSQKIVFSSPERQAQRPGELRSADQLVVGQRYERVLGLVNAVEKFTLYSKPQAGCDAIILVQCDHLLQSTVIYLCDSGMTPYENGEWNLHNYIRQIEEEEPE